MADQHVTGLFVWNELMTKDVKVAQDFYTQLFGWTFKHEKIAEIDYHMAFVGEEAVAGMMQLQPGQGEHSAWLNYVTVDDVDQRTTRATELGGRKILDAMDIPNIGRFSIISDPAGACISPFRGTEPSQHPQEKPGAGTFCWYELMTRDPEQAKQFYPEIFGWELEKYDAPGRPYWMFSAGEKAVAGIEEIPAGADFPEHWLSYVAVADVDATAKRAAELGGQVYKEPTDIPNIGRFAVLADPTGGVIALFKEQPKP
ncbi:MAG: VOC family protein [Candidatus Eisenbacteria sp.]|nr:VOC family protein [Candidatus Eisenbacteria bacterium]